MQAPYSSFGSLSVVGNKLVTVGGSPTQPSEVAVLELGTSKWATLQKALDLDVSRFPLLTFVL